jgi:hypothetical protein
MIFNVLVYQFSVRSRLVSGHKRRRILYNSMLNVNYKNDYDLYVDWIRDEFTSSYNVSIHYSSPPHMNDQLDLTQHVSSRNVFVSQFHRLMPTESTTEEPSRQVGQFPPVVVESQ